MRASSSRSAAARRTRLLESRAGVMSASRVNRGNPCRRAARAPMRTNSTWCRASVVNRSSGSRGAPAPGTARSDTARAIEEVADVPDLLEALLGRHPHDASDLAQHVRSHHDPRFQLRVDVEVRRFEEAFERLPGGACLALLDASDDGLGRAGSARERALAQAGASASLKEDCGSVGHDLMIANWLSLARAF